MYFKSSFENTIHPQKVWSVTLFSLPQVHPIASYPCSQMLIKKWLLLSQTLPYHEEVGINNSWHVSMFQALAWPWLTLVMIIIIAWNVHRFGLVSSRRPSQPAFEVGHLHWLLTPRPPSPSPFPLPLLPPPGVGEGVPPATHNIHWTGTVCLQCV